MPVSTRQGLSFVEKLSKAEIVVPTKHLRLSQNIEYVDGPFESKPTEDQKGKGG